MSEDAEWWPLTFTPETNVHWPRAEVTFSGKTYQVVQQKALYYVWYGPFLRRLYEDLDVLQLRCALIELSRNPPNPRR